MATKWVNTIMVRLGDEVRYVTGFGDGKIAYWSDGEEPYPLSMKSAKDIVFGLSINGYDAYVVTMPQWKLEYCKNPVRESKE